MLFGRVILLNLLFNKIKPKKGVLMNKKTLLIVGIIILVISLITDFIGIGIKPGFGIVQISGVIIGIILIIVGITGKKSKK